MPNVSWPAVALFLPLGLVVILIVTRLLSPATAEWIMAPIVNLTDGLVGVLDNFGSGD